jgi:hypothetical protein
MRTFVVVAVTVIVTALGLGLYARLARASEAVEPTMADLSAKLDALQRDMDNVVGCAHYAVVQHGSIRRQIDDLRTEQASLHRLSREEFLRLLIEDRDNQQLYENRERIIFKCEEVAKTNGLRTGIGDCIRTAIETQRQLFEIRRRLIPPDSMIVSVGSWTPVLESELKGLRDWQFLRFQELAGEKAANLLMHGLEDIQQLHSDQWDPNPWLSKYR